MKRIEVLVLSAILAGGALAGEWHGRFRFSEGGIDVQPVTMAGARFDLVTTRPDAGLSREKVGVHYMAEPGSPLLPYWSVTVVVPQGMRVAEATVTPGRSVMLSGTYRIAPASAPTPASVREPNYVAPDPAVYASGAAWPGRYGSCGLVGVKSGFRLVTVDLYPLQYYPSSGRLELATEMEVTLRYEPDPAAVPEALTPKQLALFGGAVRELVTNPTDVARYAPPARELDFGEYDYVIVTSSGLESYFQPLVTWRQRQGFATVVRTTSWIYSNYSGRDNQEKIRNFVRDYYTNRGTRWLLLGGDNSVVPARRTRAVVGSYVGDIPCDLYYADLQWSWDGDNDNIFGEAGHDTVDLYYDLYVGRASVESQSEVQTFVGKVITHETNPPTDYLRRILLVDALLWAGYNHEQSNDSIDAITPTGWSDVHFHDPQGTTAVRDSLNHGFQFCHMVGHGNDVGIYNGSTAFYGNGVISGHNNGSRVGLINSIACYPGNYEYSDCLAEMSHNCTTGGALAVLFNSRYGWGTPPVIGPSEILDVRFYDYFFNHDTLPIGLTHAESKEVYAGLAQTQQVWRWCYYELTMFGDPLQMMYENVPAQLSAAFTSPIGTGPQSFPVTVTSGGSPVNRALVCVWKGSEVYDRGYTNSSGQVSFSINPATTGWMQVTATAQNYLPDVDSCQVISANYDAGCYRIIAPSGTVDSGANVSPRAMVRNYSPVPLSNIPVRFRIGPYTGWDTIATLAAGDSAQADFPSWSAVPGSYTTICSTCVSGDIQNSNDYTTGALFVRYRDVGTMSVAATSPVDSGAAVAIVATVRNYGNVNETFDIRANVSGGGYSQVRTKTLAAGAQDTAIFPSWTATTRGSHVVTCSTELGSDMYQANNRATTSVLVNVRDVGCYRIVTPSGTIDSAQTLPVQARVRNYGNTTETFLVRFRIAGPLPWTDVATVNNLGGGDSALVSFNAWVTGPRGSYTTSCSTDFSGDMVSANNKATGSFSIRVRDAACLAVLSPVGALDSGVAVPVRGVIANRSSGNENIKVVMRVGAGYFDSLTVMLTPNQIDTIDFANWPVRVPRGSYAVTCSTWIAGDVRPADNVQRGQVSVVVRDVAAVSIYAPIGDIDSGSVIAPRARVANDGSEPASFTARLSISDGYIGVRNVDLAPGHDSVIVFPYWTASQVGTLTARCSVALAGDMKSANDRISGSLRVVASDVGVNEITAPAAAMDPASVNPACRVINRGLASRTFYTWCRIIADGGTEVYRDSALVVDLPPDSTREVMFWPWDAQSGRYSVRCSVGLGDRNPANDTLARPCLVYTHDVAMVRIVSPTGIMRPQPTSPIVRVTNRGTAPEDFPVKMVIEDTVTGTRIYVDSTDIVNLAPAETRDVRLKTWPGQIGYLRVVAFTMALVDTLRANDTLVAALKVTPGEIGWEQRRDMPAGAAPVKSGGSLCRAGDRIYALKGNKTFEFYSYRPQTAAWQTLTPVPTGPSGRPVNKSGDMCSDGGRSVYVVKGNKTFEFFRYDTDGGRWTELREVPPGAKPLRGGTGIAWLNRGDSSFVYLLKASNTVEFYAFNVQNGNWRSCADAPLGGMLRKFKSGSALCSDGRYVYAAKSKENDFYRYDPDRDAWQPLEPVPPYNQAGKRSRCKDGCDLVATDNGLIYAFVGGNREYFYQFNIATGRWSELSAIPPGPSGKKVKHGGSLAVMGKVVYALKGAGTIEFWTYTPDTMMFFQPSEPQQQGIVSSPVAGYGLSVAPLVTRDRITVRYSAPDRAPVRVALVSALGRVVLERELAAGAVTSLSLVHLPAGTYFLRAGAGAAQSTAKVVLNR